MNKKVIKTSLIILGIIGISYGAFKLTDILTGTIRLKYATYKIVKETKPSESSEDFE